MKHIIIMGATSGIGLRVAEMYARAGWRVGAAGRKENVLKELKQKFPEQVEWERIDVTADDASLRLGQLIHKTGGMNIYLHVSGIGFENNRLIAEEELSTLQTNVIGFARMVGTAFRHFRDKCGGKGQIAAITSVAGTNGIGELASYSSSKRFQQTYLTALEQLSNMQGMNMTFTDIRPGWVRTPLLKPDRKYPFTMELDEVAPLVVRAIRTKRRVVVIDWRWNIGYQLWRLIPNCLWVKLDVPVSQPTNPRQEKQNAAIEAATANP